MNNRYTTAVTCDGSQTYVLDSKRHNATVAICPQPGHAAAAGLIAMLLNQQAERVAGGWNDNEARPVDEYDPFCLIGAEA